MKEKILELLRNDADYISGQEICNQLGISRTAVWKNINALREKGYVIDSVTNRGYRILSEPDAIEELRIREYLKTGWLGQNIIYESQMDSTNTKAKQLAEAGALQGTVVVTEVQTTGRGRRGRTWISPQGNCYFSLILRPDMIIERASMITLVAALAMVEAIHRVTDLDVGIKWPNDLVVGGKKICGILTESSTDLEYIHYVVVGIGVNVNQTLFATEIQKTASSIRLATGQSVRRAKLIGEFLNIFEHYYQTFLETNDLSQMIGAYNQCLINCGREVKILEQGNERVRKAIGIDHMGRLIVEDKTGRQEKILSGEVSVRGLYGYV